MKMNVPQAKAQLSGLVHAALTGDAVIIAKAGKPCVRLVPLDPPARQPGSAKGKAARTSAFFEHLPEDGLAAWDGR